MHAWRIAHTHTSPNNNHVLCPPKSANFCCPWLCHSPHTAHTHTHKYMWTVNVTYTKVCYTFAIVCLPLFAWCMNTGTKLHCSVIYIYQGEKWVTCMISVLVLYRQCIFHVLNLLSCLCVECCANANVHIWYYFTSQHVTVDLNSGIYSTASCTRPSHGCDIVINFFACFLLILSLSVRRSVMCWALSTVMQKLIKHTKLTIVEEWSHHFGRET